MPDPQDYTLLLVDDEPNLRKVLGALLRKEGYEVLEAANGVEALGVLDSETVEVVISDLKMPKMDGNTLLKEVRLRWPELPFVMLTAHGTVDAAVEALKNGALDFLSKPFDKDEIRMVVAKALRTVDARAESLTPGGEAVCASIVGEHPKVREVFHVISKVSRSPSTVLLTGESGTGKELVAHAIHENSDRADKPFVKINCAAIPSTLIESELFGYEKGAFTGAVTSKPGRFELADGGTLFLDEIGEVTPEMQVKLLHVLQDGEFERVGAVSSTKVDVRLIAATNRDLAAAAREGRFREDLFYRLNVVPIQLPALRQRASDIPALVEHFRTHFNDRLGRNVQRISDDAMAKLEAHNWPGNIRELENVMERAMLFSDGEVIEASDLPELRTMEATGDLAEDVRLSDEAVERAALQGNLKDAVKSASRRVEKEIILRTLQATNWNVTRTARQLGISRKGLQLKMKELDLRRQQPVA
ncbi:MAG: sigma-54-dependent Fis family transcriptional regulator [Chrysiogenetes bacterium]|nr:sigma-54-dependent Fis family transcriptional regulator [Chrysiogenetes bacterium]